MRNQSIKKILGHTMNIGYLNRESKRAWAELFEMERRIIRLQFLLRLYGVLLVGFMVGLILNKMGY